MELPTWLSGQRIRLQMQEMWIGEIPWRRKWQPTPVFLPGKFHGQGEPEGLQSMGSQRDRYDWVSEHTHMQIAFSSLIYFPSLLRTRQHLTHHCFIHSTQHNVLQMQSAQERAAKWANEWKSEWVKVICLRSHREQCETKAEWKLVAANLEINWCCSA